MHSELWPVDEFDDQPGAVTREVVVDASEEEVWQAIATEDGRDRWLARDSDTDVEVEVSEQPERLVWWWTSEPGGARTRVEFLIDAVAAGTRVIVIESAPRFPLEMLASSMMLLAV